MYSSVLGIAFSGGPRRQGRIGSTDFRHFAIGTDIDDIVVASEAKIAHQAHLLCQEVIVG